MLKDVWVNWFQDAIMGYEVFDFHEWRKGDKTELIDEMPFFKVEENFFHYVENGINSLPDELIDMVRRRSLKRVGYETRRGNSFIISDGNRVLAIDPANIDLPYKKSRLKPDKEIFVTETLNELEPIEFEITDDFLVFDVMSTPPHEYMAGLTRREIEFKLLFLEAAEFILYDCDLPKLRYFYSEWDSNNYKNILHLNHEELYELFVTEIIKGWEKRHLELFEVLIKHDVYYENQFEAQMKKYLKIDKRG